ncbi:MAG: hypothetical protein GXO91_10970 [FCB group bacterium]|nr:hypothetical protein [FCB group bacterium]
MINREKVIPKAVLGWLCFASLLSPLTALNGTVLTETFYSESLGSDRSFTIYLPETYPGGTDPYPVLYFLHGFGANHLFYGEVFDTADALISDGTIGEMIIVKPDGSASPYLGSFYTNSELYGPYEDYIVYDLVNYIDATYRTLPQRCFRGISGHSMGGYGAMELALKHPDLFGAVSSHSGPVALSNTTDLIPDLMAETWFGVFLPTNGIVSMFMFGASGAFSPNLQNPPFYVDLPVTPAGTVIPEIFDLWMLHDPLSLAMEDISRLDSVAVYLDCGDQDDYYFDVQAQEFSDSLTAAGIPHEFTLYPGDHLNNIAQRYPYSLAFHAAQFQQNVCTAQPGDLNWDASIDVVDVVLLVNWILSEDPPTEMELAVGDILQDGELNVVDVVLLVDMILNG